MSIIKVMDDILANKIAAGEVVERPVSVVKELVENSIDANSKNVKIEIIEGGIQKIMVTDDGKGMDEEDACLAFMRHATSKVIKEDDLYRIQTLGFRGEALPSIASVSKVTLKSCAHDIGTLLEISGGVTTKLEKGDARIGTSISVNNLFFNTPARLKHLKSVTAEVANIADFVNKIALANPHIKFSLTSNDREIMKTDGRGELLKTIKDIYGMEVAKKMYHLSCENADYRIEGYISYPEINRANRNHMITIVNGRIVKNNQLNKVINDSYHTYKPDNRYPIVVLDIKTDPSLIDVNIHPTKMDIKFSKMDLLSAMLNQAIRKIIKGEVHIPEVVVKETPPTPNVTEFTLDLGRNESSVIENNTLDLFINEDLTFDNKTVELGETKKETLPELYPIALLHGTYIICQNERGMYLIDQHAAKERVNYEIVKKRLGNPHIEVTSLLIPITREFTNNEYMILKEHFDLIKNLGIGIEEFGINSVIIKSHPTWLPTGQEEEAIKRILELVLMLERNFDLEKFNERIAINMSCKMSIKANTYLNMAEMEYLIDDLRKCDNPFNCPHGRPTMILYTKYDLEKQFKRTGFESYV